MIVKIVIVKDSVWIFRYFVERPGRCRHRILQMLEPKEPLDLQDGLRSGHRRGAAAMAMVGTVWVCVMDSIL